MTCAVMYTYNSRVASCKKCAISLLFTLSSVQHGFRNGCVCCHRGAYDLFTSSSASMKGFKYQFPDGFYCCKMTIITSKKFLRVGLLEQSSAKQMAWYFLFHNSELHSAHCLLIPCINLQAMTVIHELKAVQSLRISPWLPVLMPTLPSFLIAVAKARLKLPGLLAKFSTVGLDAESVKSVSSEVNRPLPWTRFV